MKYLPIVILAVLTGCSAQMEKQKPFTMEELAIEVHGKSREVAYTNKQAGYYYTETNGEHRSGWQGWHIMSQKMMDDYMISVNDHPLRKSDAQFAQVFPHQIQRSYVIGVQETFTMLDSLNALVVQLDRVKGSELTASPLFSESPLSSDYTFKFDGNTLLIAKNRHLQRTEKENYPAWLGVTIISGKSTPTLGDSSVTVNTLFSPALTKISVQNSSAVVIFTVGDTPEETASLSALVRLNYASLIAARKMRMENLLNESYLRTDNEQVTKALNWAKLSMDALLMNQLKKGIFAGLPWFDDYWGRDSYISLPGATLVTGRFAEAKDILRSFAQWQDTVPASPTYGRIPNLVTTNSIAYNTADGTPRFTMALNEYVRYSDDSAFAREMYPAVKTAIDGTIAHHMDEHCFLTHGDAETWMDAVGPDGPWSPRGNRANDLQELWYRQLQVGVGLAQVMGDYPSALQWGKIRDSLKENFNRDFVNPKDSLLYDHLLPDGTADTHLRPNQLFALDLLQDSDLRAKIFRNVTEKLVYLHGVVSLSQEDENFHPYHHYSPYYVQDAAYHNGIVWTWLSGRWIDEATRDHLPDLAFQVTDNTIHQMLDRGAVGTISELLDAAPRKGDPEPQLSGAFSQAWGLAEFIRSFYQSYLGVSVDASVPRLIIRPMLPKAIGKVRFVIPIGTNKIEAQYVTTSNGGEYTFSNADSLRDFQIRYEHAFDDGKMEIYETHLLPQSFLTLVVEGRSVKETGNDRARALQPAETQDGVSPSLFAGIKLAEPTILPSLKALKGPDYKVLTHEEIKTANSQAQVIYDVSDPEGDDNGGGSYVYPQTPYLKPGSLDITHCTISADANNMYFNLRFRNLSNPGWHPEYGFQLTYVAIVIDKNDGSGSKEIGMNSSYNTGKDFSIDNIIYIGGGVRIVDGAHKIIAEYLPGSGDETNPLGNVSNKSITFAVPQDIIGKPARDWKYLILVGAQDDHGGAGVGEFRTVEKEAKEWNGGGKKNPSDPNVYDVILPRASF